MKVSGEVRSILLKNSIFFEVAGIRLEWSAGFSRISDAPGCKASLVSFFSWWNKENRVLILPILPE